MNRRGEIWRNMVSSIKIKIIMEDDCKQFTVCYMFLMINDYMSEG